MMIVLVRHGRSAHVQRGLLDRTEFLRWRDAYEAAGIDDSPPASLKALACDVVVASTAPRAVQSAQLLASEVVTSPLLRELELAPPKIRLRMPLLAWALLIPRRVLPEELQRAREAAEWLGGLAERHGTVLAVTHGSFRSLLSAQLVERGWRCATRPRRWYHWSAWTFRQGA